MTNRPGEENVHRRLQGKGGEDASNDLARSDDRHHGDARDELHGVECERREDQDPDLGALGPGSLGTGPLALGRMATVETGDPYLDRLAHAVAIDHLRREHGIG